MKYLRIITAFANAVWAIQEEKYLQMRDFIIDKASGEIYSAEEVKEKIGAKVKKETGKREPALAVIPIYGVIAQRLSLMDEISGPGSASTERISRDIKTALADPQISGILLDIDSPGGTVFGVTELSEEIFNARGQKPIIAMINSLAASAAYWIGSAADEISITPSGEAGSIGVFAEHTDISEFLKKKGVKPTLISAGKYKVEGNPYSPLGEEAKNYLQSRIDSFYKMFIDSVARNRGVTPSKVEKEYGQGRLFLAGEAIDSGMADRIETFNQSISRLAGAAGVKSAVLVDPGDTQSGTQENDQPGNAVIDSNKTDLEKKEIIVEEGSIDVSGRPRPPIEENTGEQIAYFTGPIAPHKTATSDKSWDGPENEKRLPSPMSAETARKTYAWMEDDAIKDDKITKEECRFIHHEVSEEGKPGAANLTACSNGIGVLNGGRGGTTIPPEDRQGVYDHLAKHLRDGDKEPPPLSELKEAGPETATELEIEKIKNDFGL